MERIPEVEVTVESGHCRQLSLLGEIQNILHMQGVASTKLGVNGGGIPFVECRVI
jgi:hypothetical protein